MQHKLVVVILTYNESIHIARAINNVQNWADKIIVLDSYSEDNTVEIAKNLGAEIIFRKFDDYKNQRQFAIDYCKNLTEWMLFLDADEYLLEELKDEIKETISIDSNVDGYYLSRRAIFMGKWIKHGGYYPTYILRLFKPQLATIFGSVNEHISVSGKTKNLKNDFVDHNLKGIFFWLHKHNQYTDFEAQEFYKHKKNNYIKKRFRLTVQAERKQWIKQNIWNHLPLFLRPFLYFSYRYFFRFGFLDGKIGLVYHFLQGCVNCFLVDAKYFEMQSRFGSELEKKEETILLTEKE